MHIGYETTGRLGDRHVSQLLELRRRMATRSGAGSAMPHLSRASRSEVPKAIRSRLRASCLTRSGGDGCRVSAPVPEGAQRATSASRRGAAFAFLRRCM